MLGFYLEKPSQCFAGKPQKGGWDGKRWNELIRRKHRVISILISDKSITDPFELINLFILVRPVAVASIISTLRLEN